MHYIFRFRALSSCVIDQPCHFSHLRPFWEELRLERANPARAHYLAFRRPYQMLVMHAKSPHSPVCQP